MSPLLIKARAQGREIVEVTPASANWSYVGFRALRLQTGESEREISVTRELCVVVVSGQIDLDITMPDGRTERLSALGTRDGIFAPQSPPPAAVYIPAHHTLMMTATQPSEVALCAAPADRQPRTYQIIKDMACFERGTGSNQRFICDILPETNPMAASLLVVEVRTPAGHSSSYPPHRHDEDDYPNMTLLEETYYHRVNPPQGFVLQRVYSDDLGVDETCTVEDRDVVLVPRGYHPVVVPHGYTSYYLNVMAGPMRRWVIKNDPRHEWMLQR